MPNSNRGKAGIRGAVDATNQFAMNGGKIRELDVLSISSQSIFGLNTGLSSVSGAIGSWQPFSKSDNSFKLNTMGGAVLSFNSSYLAGKGGGALSQWLGATPRGISDYATQANADLVSKGVTIMLAPVIK